MSIPSVKLINGASMPAIGLGTWPMDDAEAAVGVRTGIEAGFRLIDTAEHYGNETGVGVGIRDSGVPREELFVTTKFNSPFHSVDGVAQTWANSCERMGLDYIDLLLIHWPCPWLDQYVEAWKGLVALLEQGKVRAIGGSNFHEDQFARMVEATGVTPDVNQIQLSPYTRRLQSVADNAARGIVTEAWSPIKPAEMLAEPVITAIAGRLGATPAQVVLRWHTAQGIVPIPKSSSPVRQAENLASFDFSLSSEDMTAINTLDRGEVDLLDDGKFGH